MRKIVILIVILVAVFVGYYCFIKNTKVQNEPESVNPDLTVLIGGYGGKNDSDEWFGESAPFLSKMDSINDESGQLFNCQSGYSGRLFGNRVLMVTTGMAKVNTSLCISQILQLYGKQIQEVIVVGTAGVTPTKGGLLDASGNVRNDENAMIGDVCVSFMAVDFDLQYYSSDQAGTGTAKPVFLPFNENFSGRNTIGSSVLANELFDSAEKVVWPSVPEKIVQTDTLYHQNSRNPKVWGSKECMEVTGDLYWNDIKADESARKMVSDLINHQYAITLSHSDVLVFTSMEAVPVGLAVQKYNKAQQTGIKFAYIRGASNFDQTYLTSRGIPATTFITDKNLAKHTEGSEYAIQTAALPILKMFENRSNRNY